MIIELKISNFRSIRDEVVFSMIAESGQANSDNIAEITLANNSSLRLLKSIVIYGTNASGKTNFIRAIHALNKFVLNSADFKVDEDIPYYEPFLFDNLSSQQPCKIEFTFAIKGIESFIKYKYTIEFTGSEVLAEQLDYYPKGMIHNLFKREKFDELKDIGRLSKALGYKEYELFKNQLLLSKFGKDFTHDILSRIYLYFTEFEVWNALDTVRLEILKDKVVEDIFSPNNEWLIKRLNKLMRIADIKIESIKTKETSESDFKFPKDFPNDLKKHIVKANKNQIMAEHIVYENNQKTGSRYLPFKEESSGTNALFAVGGVILKKLQSGGAIIFDELNNSLHPKLTKFLVRLFNNPIANPNNTQLIFATHEVTLLDNSVFRKDQIWITEKDNFGSTDLYCIKENPSIRDDMPFDKWYMSGKLGGQPKIKEVEFIFGDE